MSGTIIFVKCVMNIWAALMCTGNCRVYWWRMMRRRSEMTTKIYGGRRRRRRSLSGRWRIWNSCGWIRMKKMRTILCKMTDDPSQK